MKTILKIASVLTWVNIVLWGAGVIFGMLVTLLRVDLAGLLLCVLLSAIPLSCFAALKLHTSLRYPNVPLSRESAAGIRFVGFMALFFGIWMVTGGIDLMADPSPIIDGMKKLGEQLPKEMRAYYQVGRVFGELVGAVVLMLGLSIAVNTVLNLRLLRWYYLNQVRR
jgi:hypothetical protein